jgi:hypothetical protein
MMGKTMTPVKMWKNPSYKERSSPQLHFLSLILGGLHPKPSGLRKNNFTFLRESLESPCSILFPRQALSFKTDDEQQTVEKVEWFPKTTNHARPNITS